MKTSYAAVPAPTHWRLWIVCVAMFSFAAGALLTIRVVRLNQVRADSQRVFELMIYHTNPGKAPALESVFREAHEIMAKHDIHVIGFWRPNEDPAWNDTFVYLIAHPSRDAATKNWQALHTDPKFRPYIEAAKPLIERTNDRYHVDEVYMRPTDFSAMH